MYPSLPYGRMITVIHRKVSGRDEFGNDTYTETTMQVGPCAIQPGSSRETIDFNDQVNSAVIVYMPYGTDVKYIDAMIVDGVTYEVSGKTESWQSPFSGHTSPVRVYGTEVEGASN